MKHLILSMLLIVAPVLAAEEEVLSMEPGQAVQCHHPGGCIALSKVAMRNFIQAMQQHCGRSI